MLPSRPAAIAFLAGKAIRATIKLDADPPAIGAHAPSVVVVFCPVAVVPIRPIATIDGAAYVFHADRDRESTREDDDRESAFRRERDGFGRLRCRGLLALDLDLALMLG